LLERLALGPVVEVSASKPGVHADVPCGFEL
jgi:hypothetical protein